MANIQKNQNQSDYNFSFVSMNPPIEIKVKAMKQQNSQNSDETDYINVDISKFQHQKFPKGMRQFFRQKKSNLSINRVQNKNISNFIKFEDIKNVRSSIQLNNNNFTTSQIIQSQVFPTEQPNPQNGRNIIFQKDQKINESLSICSICETLIQKEDQVSAFQCEHIFCQQCIINYIKVKISMSEEVYCAQDSCERTLNVQNVFFNKLSIRQRKQYLNIHNFYKINFKNVQKPKRLCPNQNCQGVIELKQNQPYQTCLTCQKSYCTLCFLPSHQGQCQNFQIKYMKQNLKLRQCIKCLNFIMKDQGCKHITCKCGYQFCQECNKQWKRGHICKFVMLNQKQDECDYGLTNKQHLCYLLKIPLKFILIIICALLWFICSFLCLPLNVFMFIYWLFLIFIKPTCEKQINNQNGSSSLKKLLIIIFFPVFGLINIKVGINKLIQHIDSFIPQLSNSFRYIIRL